MPNAIPLLTSIERTKHHDDDRREYLLQLGVIGSNQRLAAVIEVSADDVPQILHVGDNGGFAIPTRVRDKLIHHFFELYRFSLEDTTVFDEGLADVTRLIEDLFLPQEAIVLLNEFRKQLDPNLTVDARDCTTMVPLSNPARMGWHHAR